MGDICFFDLTKSTIHEVIKILVQEQVAKDDIDAFAVLDLSYVKRQFLRWQKNFPNIEPFYAVKANDNEHILRTMASSGGSFDCASQAEMERVLALGVSPSRIVYANPVRCRKMLQFARERGVDLLTADCATELGKIAAYHPSARIVVRILPPLVKTNFWLGKKFGLPIERLAEFVQHAKTLKLNVVGVSFHCGSPFQDADAVARAVPVAKQAFEILAAAGYEPYVLDIGGGFPGNEPHMTSIFPTLEAIAKCTRAAIEHHFPGCTFDGRALKLMAEPGQYMVYSAQTLVARVIGKKRIEECLPSADMEPDSDMGPRLPLPLTDTSMAVRSTGSMGDSANSSFDDSSNVSIDDCPNPNDLIDEIPNASLAYNSSGTPVDSSKDSSLDGQLDDRGEDAIATRDMRTCTLTIPERGSSTPRFVYFVNHGKYGHFVFIKGYLDDTLKPLRVPFGKQADNEVLIPSIIYGPTCDTADIIMENVSIPELEIDNWIYFEGMGAYTNVVACEFNGFPIIRTVVIADSRDPELDPRATALLLERA